MCEDRPESDSGCCDRGVHELSVALLFHDFSSFSKSGLTVAMPVLEALSLEAAAIPTCVLSTQTDGFSSPYGHDLSADILPIYEKIKEEGYSFSYIYSGYVLGKGEFHALESIIEREDALVLIDPVLGDHGGLYSGLGNDHVTLMRSYISKGDIITPNITEAVLLTGKAMKKSYSNRDLLDIFKALSELGSFSIALTSVPLEIGCMANVAYKDGQMRLFPFDEVSTGYPGSGDLFASLLLGLTNLGYSFFPAVKTAGELSSLTIRGSYEMKRERRLGVSLSPLMEELRRRVL